jgi:hypothetical protein
MASRIAALILVALAGCSIWTEEMSFRETPSSARPSSSAVRLTSWQ